MLISLYFFILFNPEKARVPSILTTTTVDLSCILFPFPNSPRGHMEKNSVSSSGMTPDVAGQVPNEERIVEEIRDLIARTPIRLSLIHISEPTRPY